MDNLLAEAGILFVQGRYEEAADAYAKALGEGKGERGASSSFYIENSL